MDVGELRFQYHLCVSLKELLLCLLVTLNLKNCYSSAAVSKIIFWAYNSNLHIPIQSQLRLNDKKFDFR